MSGDAPAAASQAWRRALRRASPVVVGQFVAQALGVVLLPPLLGAVAPADFGRYSAVLSVCVVVGAVGALRLEALLPQLLPERRGAVQGAARALSLLVPVGVALVVAAAAALTRSTAVGLLAVGVLVIGTTTSLLSVGTYQAVAEGRMTRTAAARVVQAGGAPGLQLGLALAGARSAAALVLADGLARLAAVRVLERGGRPSTGAGLRGVRREVREHRAHVAWYGLATLLNMAATQVPLVLAPAVLGAGAAGVYALAHRLALVPSSLLALALGQAFHHEFGGGSGGRGAGGAALAASVRHLHRRVCCVVGAAFFLVAAAGPALVRLAVPDAWDDAGQLVAVLSVWAAAVTAAGPFASILLVTGRQAESLLLNALDLVVKTGVALAVVTAAAASSMVFAAALSAGTTAAALISGYRFVRPAGLRGPQYLANSALALVPALAGAAVGLAT